MSPASEKYALRLYVDSWRWSGVPFYVRAGKCLAVTATEVFVEFRNPPQVVFKEAAPKVGNYVRFRLSGERAIDVADASGTLLFDVARRRWSGEMVAAAGLDQSMLPAVFESPEVCARVSPAGAAKPPSRRAWATARRSATATPAPAGSARCAAWPRARASPSISTVARTITRRPSCSTSSFRTARPEAHQRFRSWARRSAFGPVSPNGAIDVTTSRS